MVEKLAGLLDTGVEKRPILHDVLDVFDGEVDKHTSDLRSLGSNNLRDVLVKHGSDLVFVVGVLWSHGVNDLVTGHQVALLHCHLLHLLLLHELLLLEHSLLLSVLRVHHAHRRLTHHLTTMHRGVALAGHWALVGVTTIASSHSLSTLLWLESCLLFISKSSPALLRHNDSGLGTGLVDADLLAVKHSLLLGGNLETTRH